VLDGQTLAVSERWFRAVFDQSFQFIGLLTPVGRVLEMNRTALEFGGLKWSDVVGRAFWETPWWASRESRRMLREAIVKAAGGESVRFVADIHGAGNRVATIDFSLRPMKDENGRVVMLIPEGRDITERRQLEREVLRASEAERERIGRDLHDSLGQNLTGIACLGKALEQRLAARGQADAASAAEIVALVNQTIDLTRALAKGLCPVGLTPDALMHSLRDFAEGVTERLGVSCRFSADPPIVVHDSTAAGNVFRIVQEAVNNAMRHGNARSVDIRIRQVDDQAVLTIEDDGVGLPEAPRPREGLGLHIMKYRAGMIGASLDVRRGDGGGTVVTCRLPGWHFVAAGG
jgi:PAS domain S-box-containing protein